MRSYAALVILALSLPLQAHAADVRHTVRAAIEADEKFPPALYDEEFSTSRLKAVAKDGLAAEGGLTGESGTEKIEIRAMRVVNDRVLVDISSHREGATPLEKTITFFMSADDKIADVDTNTVGKPTASTPFQKMPTLLHRYQNIIGPVKAPEIEIKRDENSEKNAEAEIVANNTLKQIEEARLRLLKADEYFHFLQTVTPEDAAKALGWTSRDYTNRLRAAQRARTELEHQLNNLKSSYSRMQAALTEKKNHEQEPNFNIEGTSAYRWGRSVSTLISKSMHDLSTRYGKVLPTIRVIISMRIRPDGTLDDIKISPNDLGSINDTLILGAVAGVTPFPRTWDNARHKVEIPVNFH